MKPSQLAVDNAAGAGDMEVRATLRLLLMRGGGGIVHGAGRPVSRDRSRRGWATAKPNWMVDKRLRDVKLSRSTEYYNTSTLFEL